MLINNVSSALVISLPIIVLKTSQLRRSKKTSLAIFLCLSIFMVVCAIVRANASTYYCEPAEESDEPRFKLLNPNEETFAGPVPWIFMWQQVEGLVAVVMASAVSFRTLFVRVKTKKNSQGAARPGGLNNNCRHAFRRFWPGRGRQLQEDKNPIV